MPKAKRHRLPSDPPKPLPVMGLILVMVLILILALTRTWHLAHWSGR